VEDEDLDERSCHAGARFLRGLLQELMAEA
jgi:hypothetical protein